MRMYCLRQVLYKYMGHRCFSCSCIMPVCPWHRSLGCNVS
jgi:hypothetical protein